MLRPHLSQLKVRPGDLVRWDGNSYVVAACRAGITTLKAVTDGARVDVDLAAFVDDDSFQALDRGTGTADQGVAERIILHSLSDEQKRDVLWWRDHINEVQFQVTNPLDPDARPRPGYEAATITARRTKKVEELRAAGHQVSVRTWLRKEQAYKQSGLLGLLDGRSSKVASGVPRVDPRLEQAAIDVLAETTHESTVARTVHINRVKALVHRRHSEDAEPVRVPSDSTLRRLLDAHDPARLSTGKATTRRSEANRPDRMFTPLAVLRPGQIVEADSTPVNIHVLMPDGKNASRPTLTVLVDRCTRSIIAWAFHEDAASGYDIAYLIARAMLPMQCWPGAPEHLKLANAASLPSRQMVLLDERQRAALAKPYIVPETITTDRGKDYLSANVMRACAMFGISLIQAPPHSPTAKGVVERTLGAVETMWMQYQDWYVGNAVGTRGREMRGEVMTLPEIERSFAEWVVCVWQNRPHPALADRDLPGRRFTPNQMYAACFDSTPGVPVPVGVDTFIDLLPTTNRTLQADGITWQDDVYDSPDLDGWRKKKHPHGPGGKWVIHYDPYDPDRVWVRHPETDDESPRV
jgi:putative transposase